MGTNTILPFAVSDTGTNLYPDAEWPDLPGRAVGNEPGIADLRLVNKAFRGSTLVAAALADLIAASQSVNINDAMALSDLRAAMSAVLLGTKLQNVSGYKKFGDGFLIQWGNASQSGQSTVDYSFPIAFPGYGLAIVANKGSVISANSEYALGAGIKNVSQFTITNSAASTTTQGFSWIAVGF